MKMEIFKTPMEYVYKHCYTYVHETPRSRSGPIVESDVNIRSRFWRLMIMKRYAAWWNGC